MLPKLTCGKVMLLVTLNSQFFVNDKWSFDRLVRKTYGSNCGKVMLPITLPALVGDASDQISQNP